MKRPSLRFTWTSRLSGAAALGVFIGLWGLDIFFPAFHDWSRQLEIDFFGIPPRHPGQLVPGTSAVAAGILFAIVGFVTDLTIYRRQSAEWEDD
ncbi:hypothetical protein KQI84_17380 [bacterium]|nr:hypothetical protein [bacterium]